MWNAEKKKIEYDIYMICFKISKFELQIGGEERGEEGKRGGGYV
jgi:hypothetical protein